MKYYVCDKHECRGRCNITLHAQEARTPDKCPWRTDDDMCMWKEIERAEYLQLIGASDEADKRT